MTTTMTRPWTAQHDPRAPVHYLAAGLPGSMGALCGQKIGILTTHPDRVTCVDCKRLLEREGAS